MNIKKGLLIVAIALILAFFVGYGIEVFDPTPDYNLIYQKFNQPYAFTEEECLANGGRWVTDFRSMPPERDARPIPVEGKEKEYITSGYCQAPYEKIELEKAKHDQIVFIAAVIAGILAIVAGLWLNKDTISTGIVTGGVLLLLYGTIRYWSHANNIIKFIMLGIALAILVWIAYKKLDKQQ